MKYYISFTVYLLGFVLVRYSCLAQSPGTIADFLSVDGADDDINDITLQSDGRVLIGGTFNTYNGISRNHIARVFPDGRLDNSFCPGTGTNEPIEVITILEDGKILIGSNFTEYDGISRRGVLRLNSSLEETLVDISAYPSGIYTIKLYLSDLKTIQKKIVKK